jgi:peptide-methionine (S)-S-oxide reductase
MLFGKRQNLILPTQDECFPGRKEPINIDDKHFIFDAPLKVTDSKYECAYFAMGCFWGAERKFWQVPGAYSTAVGYAGGFTPNPTYDEVCSGRTGHTEIVQIYYDASIVSYIELLKVFWESHDPTQGMKQGNDVGTQYRSAIYCTTMEQLEQAESSKIEFQKSLTQSGLGLITSEIKKLVDFYYAESYHQQYLAKNPNGYCGLKSVGVEFASTN